MSSNRSTSPSVDELLDQHEQERLHAEASQLLYGDLEGQQEGGDSTGQLSPRAMDLDESLLDEDTPAHPALSVEGFGEHFLAGLQKFLAALKPFVGDVGGDYREMTYSAAARMRMTEDARKASAPLYEGLLDALMADRKIQFRKVEPKLLSCVATKGFFCPCELTHAAILQCSHYADKHSELCSEVVAEMELRTKSKQMVTQGTQTDRFIIPKVPSVPEKKPVETATTSTATPKPNFDYARGFSRGGNRGHSSGSSNRGQKRSQSRHNDGRGGRGRSRSRSAFSRENRGTRDINSNEDRSVSFESRRSQDERSRSRSQSRRPSQPAQARLREERSRMEEPENRKLAEDAAARAKREADKIAKELGLTSASTSQPKPKVPGDSIMGSDGFPDYSNVPRVVAPAGMRAIISVKDNKWDVQFTSKE
jgi:hypothetical protein